MLIETLELTLSHVGLGDLSESALLALWASAQAHCLTAGTGTTLRQVVDTSGHTLYPAYYMTHLRVPPSCPLDGYRLWEKVAIGVDVRSFGGMLLDTTAIIGREGEVAADPASWNTDALPTLRSGSMFIVEGHAGEQQVAPPRAGALAALPKLSAPPQAMDRFRQVRIQGALDPAFSGRLSTTTPIRYIVVAGRDVPAEHNLLFARFSEIMDCAESTLLAEQVWPRFPTPVLNCRRLLEREMYYFGNCQAGQTLEISLRGQLRACPPDLHGPSNAVVSAGVLTFAGEMYHQPSGALLVAGQVSKLLAVPSARQSLLRDVERLLFQLS